MKNSIISIALAITLFFISMGVVKAFRNSITDVMYMDKATSEVQLVTEDLIEMNISAYCPCEKCCGKWADGFFADGSPVGGKAIAADTSIYPMGTKFNVPGYGIATVKDRGGAIKGNKLDLYFDTHQEALNWGRQQIIVTRVGI